MISDFEIFRFFLDKAHIFYQITMNGEWSMVNRVVYLRSFSLFSAPASCPLLLITHHSLLIFLPLLLITHLSFLIFPVPQHKSPHFLTRNISLLSPNLYFYQMTESQVIDQLKTVYDPEIPVNIFDLGLVYDVKVLGSQAYIVMTLTTATCPAAAFMPEEVKTAVLKTPGITGVEVDVVYEPRWTKDRMSEEAKNLLGFS